MIGIDLSLTSNKIYFAKGYTLILLGLLMFVPGVTKKLYVIVVPPNVPGNERERERERERQGQNKMGTASCWS